MSLSPRRISVGNAEMEVAYVPMPGGGNGTPGVAFQYFNLHDNDKTEIIVEAARLLHDAVPSGMPLWTAETATYEIAHELRKRGRTVHTLAKKPRCDVDPKSMLCEQYGAVTSSSKNSSALYATPAAPGEQKVPEQRVAFFDNVTTSGETIKAAARLLLRKHIIVDKVFVLFTEGEEISEIAVNENYIIPLVSLCGHLPVMPLPQEQQQQQDAVTSQAASSGSATNTNSANQKQRDPPSYFLRAQTILPTTEYGRLHFCVFENQQESTKTAIAVFGKQQQQEQEQSASSSGVSPFPMRVHDACVTSELFQSSKCDCADQLQFALKSCVRDHGGGCIYLPNEGRGIGIAAKIEAYRLQQEEGLDTVDANRALRLPDDSRSYAAVRDICAHFNIDALDLWTNNPHKVQAIEKAGVRVAKTTPCVVPPRSTLCAAYLRTKRERMGHENLDSVVTAASADGPEAPVAAAAPGLIPDGMGWSIVRIVAVPLEESSTAATFPTVTTAADGGVPRPQNLDPKGEIGKGPKRHESFFFCFGRSKKDGRACLGTKIDSSWFESVHDQDSSPVHGFTYPLLSEHELCLFLVGPATATAASELPINITGRWPGRRVTIVGPGSEIVKNEATEATSGSSTVSGSFAVRIPIEQTQPLCHNYKGPFGALEVQTKGFLFDEDIFLRLEQFSVQRIPLPQFNVWRENSRGGYSSYLDKARCEKEDRHPSDLERGNSAVFGFIFALRQVFRDSGWAQEWAAAQGSEQHLALLGFETNNVIHDDFDAPNRAVHLHVALKSAKKARERNPAFYVDPKSGKVRDLNYSGTVDVELSSSRLFGVVRRRGSLALGCLVRLKSRRTGMYLYVRESERGASPPQQLFQTSDGEMEGGNANFVLLGHGGNSSSNNKTIMMLCSVRSNTFVSVADGHPNNVDSLVQAAPEDSDSSRCHWIMEPSACGNFWRLLSAATNLHYATAFFRAQALPIGLFDHATSDGAEWLLERQVGDQQWAPVRAGRGDGLPPSYEVACTELLETAEATIKISKRGSAWAEVKLKRNMADAETGSKTHGIGRIVADTTFSDRSVLAQRREVNFDLLTGKLLSKKMEQL